MKNRKITLALALVLLMPLTLRADEGLWLLSLISKNHVDMQNSGWRLTPEDIYSSDNTRGTMKDAIVGLSYGNKPLDFFCTGAIISNEGLIATSYHSLYPVLRNISPETKDILSEGFWAYTKETEIAAPGLTAAVLVYMEDVTDQVNDSLLGVSDESRRNSIYRRTCQKIIERAIEGTDYTANVKSMFNDNKYFLFVYYVYRDVRLVGIPPQSIGDFGGEIDNMRWPRHSCDFSLFRIYVNPDGKTPADYSKNNQPLTPKNFLKINFEEHPEGDFSMVMGFPKQTKRMLTSHGFNQDSKYVIPILNEINTAKRNALKKALDNASRINQIKYTANTSATSIEWKYNKMLTTAFNNNDFSQVKKQSEQAYLDWSRFQSNASFSRALDEIGAVYTAENTIIASRTYLQKGLLESSATLTFATALYDSIINYLQMVDTYNDNVDKINKTKSRKEEKEKKKVPDLSQFQLYADDFFRSYNKSIDQKVTTLMLEFVYKKTAQVWMQTKYKKYFADLDKTLSWDKFVEEIYAESIFTDKKLFTDFIRRYTNNPKAKTDAIRTEMNKDLIHEFASQVQILIKNLDNSVGKEKYEKQQIALRNYAEGILKLNENKNLLSPDANSTLRLSYGHIMSYEPVDGLIGRHYTTINGIIEKERPVNSGYTVPENLKRLYDNSNFGSYVNDYGELPTCFIIDNDASRGNEGSPVINGNGELIGLLIDINGEGAGSDYCYNQSLHRCICLDTRFMLWMIDVYASADNIKRELKNSNK